MSNEPKTQGRKKGEKRKEDGGTQARGRQGETGVFDRERILRYVCEYTLCSG
jgi:hypothetical protein